ncbi:hypothetical protein ES677_04415 [Bizionia gelidisalsuginis]|uniref:Uncharacterized protein n=1 Tax=Bizionia gelidisalsuginis TaxID=291188 RepID=A0ABY3MCK3_9FLAO|nr:hypothetical protein [Bizionia gelidisalsuginis]TYC15591.1 hypothetical protein ES677_04415 [Bizionia gelidisalsuginis]
MRFINRYRGFLKEDGFDTVNRELFYLMLEKEVLFEIHSLKGIYRNVDADKFTLLYEGKYYYLNQDILRDLYIIIENTLDSRVYSRIIYEKINEIEKKAFAKTTEKEKLKTLQKQREKIVKSIDCIKSFKQFIKNYDNPTFDFNRDWTDQDVFCWVCNIMYNLEQDEKTIIKYLTNSKISFNKTSDEKDSLLSIAHPINIQWKNFIKTKKILDFIDREINKNKIEKTTPVKFNRKGDAALYEVLFIDVLRKEKKESHYSDKKMPTYLNLLTKNFNKEIELQLDELKALVHLSEKEYLSFNYSELGRKINMITETNEENLRKAAVIILKKPNKKLTKIQEKYFADHQAIVTNIQDMIRKVG